MKKVLVVLGGNFDSNIRQAEQNLPRFLSKSHPVICFEFPQFSKLLRIIKREIPILEKISANLTVYHSIGFLPYGRIIPIINIINHFGNYLLLKVFLKKEIDIGKIISFTPEVSLLPIKSNINLIYHVLDDYETLPWWNNFLSGWQLKKLENLTVKRAEKIIAVSQNLVKKYKKVNSNVFLYPTPAELSAYLNYRFNKDDDINDITRLKKPIAGFIGSGTIPGKLDVELIYNLADKFPQINFVFIGLYKKKYLDFKRYPNLINLGYKNRELLAAYVANFDVCLIPYCLNKYGQSAYPVKIMEYLAMGKPVVSTALPAVEKLAEKKLIYTAENKEDFANKLEIALKENDGRLIKARKSEAEKYDWSRQIKNYLRILEK